MALMSNGCAYWHTTTLSHPQPLLATTSFQLESFLFFCSRDQNTVYIKQSRSRNGSNLIWLLYLKQFCAGSAGQTLCCVSSERSGDKVIRATEAALTSFCPTQPCHLVCCTEYISDFVRRSQLRFVPDSCDSGAFRNVSVCVWLRIVVIKNANVVQIVLK